ncbi:hypothetical protein GCM10027291_00540 [Telluribacter humicola]
MDEMFSFVGSKQTKTWIWLAIERESRQIVGLATGDRSEYCGKFLWESIDSFYQQNAVFYTDLYTVYEAVIPPDRHYQKAGGTAHIERFNNTLRQRQPHLTRKTLAFAKTDDSHFGRILNFINYYNKSKSP